MKVGGLYRSAVLVPWLLACGRSGLEDLVVGGASSGGATSSSPPPFSASNASNSQTGGRASHIVRDAGRASAIVQEGGIALDVAGPPVPVDAATDAPADAVSQVPLTAPVLSVGIAHTCLVSDGLLYCWGFNDKGQLGLGDIVDRTSPVRVDRTAWISVSAGKDHTCAILGDTAGARKGEMYCWGGSNFAPEPVVTAFPARVGTESGWSWVAAGLSHTCGILDGALYCWGNNNLGQLGQELRTDYAEPVRLGTRRDWTWVTASQSTCGIAGGELSCWGVSIYGQLGTGSGRPDYYDVRPPERVGTSSDWTSVALGGYHGCGTHSNGELWCWGYNNFEQLGDPNWYVWVETPRLALSGTRGWQPTTTHLGGVSSCWVRAGDLHCWGRNDSGQLGIGTTDYQPDPVLVSGGGWEFVTGGATTVCGLRHGKPYCWGLNKHGQLGVGDTLDRHEPTGVVTP